MAYAVRALGVLVVAALAATLAGPAAAQVKPGAQQGLGLTGADIPPLLKLVQADPYRAPADPACETIPKELAALDHVLGPDVDGGLKTKTGLDERAVGAVRGMIPYHGVVRFITRADDKDKALQAAAMAGFARRGFLKGQQARLPCSAAEPLTLKTVEADALPAAASVVDTATLTPAPPIGDHLVRLMLVAAPADAALASSEPAAGSPPAPEP